MKRMTTMVLALALTAAGSAFSQPQPAEPATAEGSGFREDARSIEKRVNAHYAYLDRLPDGRMPLSAKLRAEAEQVRDKRSLLRFAERALLTLADHHAITGSSFADSWAVVPSYSDLWIEKRGPDFRVEAVRQDSPAERAGIKPGDRLTAIEGVPTARAVEAFWANLGLTSTEERAGFAARVLAAGKRDRPRVLSVQRDASPPRQLTLPNLYTVTRERPLLSATPAGADLLITIHDSLGNEGTIAAFDAAMAQARPDQRVIIDLSETPSGGNTVVARALMGWFVSKPTAYQMHNLPAEERQTGIPRQWIEQVLPRTGKHHAGPLLIRVGRWTGSMGEGLALGFNAIGADVVGDPMAGLLGAIYDHGLSHSGLILKLPTERLMAVDGTPRERFIPKAARAAGDGTPPRR
ncbi:S41 family peptidase [Hyalangium rubrum]|uniref:PDZ domain-containing protein n=1 Tax=Hyalangium rubrum TaxID=3103134 RepID=A0ABU5H399_9BACT|nr:PDZ domain-containing protein [Hyalangium sp. s54d21]MDY7227850.1 PDZ domain-containing protein [Hyalangium sp. s54d21]